MLPLRACAQSSSTVAAVAGVTGAAHMACRSCTLVREAVMAASARGAQPLLRDLLVEPSWQQVRGR